MVSMQLCLRALPLFKNKGDKATLILICFVGACIYRIELAETYRFAPFTGFLLAPWLLTHRSLRQ